MLRGKLKEYTLNQFNKDISTFSDAQQISILKW